MNPPDPTMTAIYERATSPASTGPPTVDVPGGASPTGPQVSLVNESMPGPCEAFVALRLSRLRAAAAFLAVLTSLFAALFLAGGNAVWLFHGGAALCLGRPSPGSRRAGRRGARCASRSTACSA